MFERHGRNLKLPTKIMIDGNDAGNTRKSESTMGVCLRELLEYFGAASMGEGNVDAGANALAAMALSLANLADPKCRAASSNAQRVSLGCSFIASGGLTPSLVSDYVVKNLAATQNNLNRVLAEHTRVLGLRAKYIAEGDNPNSIMDPGVERKRVTQDTLIERFLLNEEPFRFPGPVVAALIDSSASEREEFRRPELLSHPAYFIGGESPHIILKMLQRTHAGHPLVCFTLKDSGSISAFDELVANVLDGYAQGNSMAKGNSIVLDPHGIMGNGHARAKNQPSWVNRMLWLVDGVKLPGFASSCDAESACKVVGVDAFRTTGLHRILECRLMKSESSSPFEPFGIAGISRNLLRLGGQQSAWCKHLSSLEVYFPGITGVLRSLPASLIAGFGAMGFKSRFGFEGLVFASYKFSMILVDRMILAHKRLCLSEKTNRQESLETRVLGTLGKKGASKSYHIAKNLNGVRVEECDQVLIALASRGLVRRGDDRFWYLVESGVVARN